jgi:hypothetical protein
MPLILNSAGWSRERLVSELGDYSKEFTKMGKMFGQPPPGLPNPWPGELAARICLEAASMAESIAALPALPPELGVRTVNHLYELQNAIPYLMRAAGSPPPPFPSRKGAPST